MQIPCCMHSANAFICDCEESQKKALRKKIKKEQILRDGEPCPPCAIMEYIIEDLERLTTHEVGKVYKFK